MPNFRLSRRALLRGAGGIAIALPWLEIMHEPRSAHAAGGVAKRLVSVYTPGGTVHTNGTIAEQWTPSGTDTDFTLSPILSAYEPVRQSLVVLQGIDMKSAVGEQTQSGMAAWLTGTKQSMLATGTLSYASGPSIDQVLAPALAGDRPLKSLELAVRWGTGKNFGKATPWDIVNFANDAAVTPVTPRIDPTLIFTQLFGALTPDAANENNWDKSILDYVDRRYASLSSRVGAADKARIDLHLTRIRELEQSLASNAVSRCKQPAQADVSDYDFEAGSKQGNDLFKTDLVTDAAIPKVGKFMLDMLVMALACDRTAVATFMWTDAEARHTFPWLGLSETFNFYQNDGGYLPEQCTTIGKWYASQNSYLLQQMAQVDMGGHSLLDESVVFFGSEVSSPADHKKLDMPFLLAGGAGGQLRGGRFLRYAGAFHNDLLVSICNLFGDPRATFGDPNYCRGPLPNLI